MTLPLVSCMLATRNQPLFLSPAIHCFFRQTYPNKELIIVDDGEASAAALAPDDAAIPYIKLEPALTLGSKLNFGIDAASGQIIQKLDDDDHYHQDFLQTTIQALVGCDSEHSIVGWDYFWCSSPLPGR
jgi:glycosyltransferase involved in cell wall biosynthesis